ncbi:salivary peroxidase/catechol oxidase-like isoform X3 [Periplaneta americana]|uniref:salivary peroxidase/catechol oxidase-like isoform X3 n=1 Tax=Periplaneta americana TaxID=6978 RepID=UPI0037E8530A
MLLVGWVCVLIVTVVSQDQEGAEAQDLFRTELFPEQLQQQQVQVVQRQIQDQLQALQRQAQAQIQQQQAQLLAQLQDAQGKQQELQRRLQEQLNGLSQQPFNLPQVPQFPIPFEQQQQIQPQQQPQPQPQFQQRPQPQPQPQPQFQPQPQPQPQFQPQPQPQPQFQPQPQPRPQPQPEFQPRPQPQPQQPLQFPEEPQVPEQAPPCSTQSGEAGFCRPLVKCITFYAEVPELRRQPCRMQSQELGVCCPLRKRPTSVPTGLDRQNHGVLRPPPPPPVVIPPFSPQQLNNAALVALERIRQRIEFVASLFANNVIVQVGTPAAWHQEFFQTTNATLEQGEEAQKNVEASVSLVNEFQLSPDQGTFALPTFSVLNTVIADSCPRPTNCRAERYRSADGSCNNLQNERWGRAGTALQRVLPPKYGDGVNSPRVAANREELPSARVVSTQFATEADIPYDNYTLLVMQWGQFLDHDLTHTPISRGQSGAGLSCCREGKVIQQDLRHPDCFPISLPQNDHIFAPFGERCMEFVRSLPAPRPECNFGPREQMNQVTGYLDGSNIYGSNLNSQQTLRERRGGRLAIQNFKGRQLLPENRGECTDDEEILACFKAGDSRVNEQVELAVMHTIWMREHNRVAGELARLNPNWGDETLFQEARRIVVAEMQHITYNEWLPVVLGRDYMDKFELSPRDNGFTKLYDDTLNPSITNVFATAAFRFGHSLIQSHMQGFTRFGNVRQNLELSHHQFTPFVLYEDGALDNFVRGLSTQPSQRFDRFFSKQLTDHLFQGDLDFGLDLVALNIQRGRDHGLPPYNDWREVCGLPRAKSWENLQDVMDAQSVAALRALYPSVDEIDLFVAAVAEKPLPGALLGQTFVCLVGDQFARLRRGDRFFYEEGGQPSTFTSQQLEQIRKANLARVLCDNSDDIALMQPLAFFQASFLNQRVPCSSESIPRMNLNAWAGDRAA